MSDDLKGSENASKDQPKKDEQASLSEKANKPAVKAAPVEKKSSDKLFSAQPAPRLQTTKSKSKLKPLPLIAITLSLAALAGIGWSGYKQYQMEKSWQQLKTEQIQLNSQQDKLTQSSNQAAQSSLQTANANQQIINQQSLLIEQLRQALTATQQRVRELSGRQKQDWLLAEAEYLIKLAQFKLTLEKDKITAIALLKTADQRILETADNSLLELRQTIAKDISDLQLVSSPDISGIASQLHAISAQIPQLNLIALEFEPLEKDAGPILQSDQEFSWSKAYQNFLNDFVTIKDHSQPVKPLMTVKQRGNLNNNIQLALQQAQIALVRGEQGLYEINLNNAFKWIGEFFQHDQTAQSILETLTQISGVAINIQLPEKLSASQSIQAINQQRLYQWLETKPAEENQQTSETDNSETSTGEQL